MLKTLPSDDVMYAALVRRDPSFDGVFFTGVRTTGIFCRSTCPARKPLKTNVEFFSRVGDAVLAGYRPCKRCRPVDSPGAPSELVRRLVDAVEADPSARWRARDLAAIGIDASTARRQFQKRFGLTFAAYVRQRRLGQALSTLRRGGPVIDAQLDAGFESASGFRDAFSRLFGDPPAGAKNGAALRADWIDTPLGPMVAVADEAALHLLEYTDRRGLEKEIERLRRRARAPILPGETGPLTGIRDELRRYFDGEALTFATPLHADQGTPFQRQVWAALRAIPAGETRSYKDVAAAVGRPAAVRAVAQANGANPLAIVVPCHRVIAADGGLSGYGGGVWRKRWLIGHERQAAAREAAA